MEKTELTYHVPVLLKECIEGLDVKPGGTYIDVTMGGGGHSRAILEKLGKSGRLYGFDQDADAIGNAPQDGRFVFIRSNFRYLTNWMKYYGALPVDGIMADLGVSSHHFDIAERGFSFRQNGPLDMRMNQEAGVSAADIVNSYEKKQLSLLFQNYGELYGCQNALADAIIRARSQKPLTTTQDLMDAVRPVLDRSREKKNLAKVFQALRIEVNHELDTLTEMLYAAVDALKPGGRLVVLSYHSLEDRLVKNFMRSGNDSGEIEKDFYGNVLSPLKALKQLGGEASAEEQERNPRSRSAKLRVGERTEQKAFAWTRR